MATLTDADIADLLKSTTKALNKDKLQQIAQRYTRYELCDHILREDRIQQKGGTSIQYTLMTDHSNAAKMVGLYEVYVRNVANVLAQIEVPWRRATSNWSWERHEGLANRSPEKVVDHIKVRRADGILSLIELVEAQGWSKPTDSTDTKSLWGIPYWIVKSATAAVGFNGGNPSGFSSCGGADVATYTRWKNCTGTFSAYSKSDMVKKMRKAARITKFMSPKMMPQFSEQTSYDFRIYTNETVVSEMEDLGEAQNENLGRDIASLDGKILFHGNPIVYVPKLDDDTDNPVYMLDMSCIYFYVQEGDFFYEHDPKAKEDQPNVWFTDIDLTCNMFCKDRRRQTVLYKV